MSPAALTDCATVHMGQGRRARAASRCAEEVAQRRHAIGDGLGGGGCKLEDLVRRPEASVLHAATVHGLSSPFCYGFSAAAVRRRQPASNPHDMQRAHLVNSLLIASTRQLVGPGMCTLARATAGTWAPAASNFSPSSAPWPPVATAASSPSSRSAPVSSARHSATRSACGETCAIGLLPVKVHGCGRVRPFLPLAFC